MTKSMLTTRIVRQELIGFALVVVLLWVDEIMDLPHNILGAESTPVNLRESLFETVIVLFLGMVVMTATLNLFNRIRHLEGFLRVCSYCRRVKTRDDWIPMEQYIRDHSEADFSHGLCPECADRHYGILAERGLCFGKDPGDKAPE